ncbi:MAG TPA: M56 family metallopeptidase, partial [Verrucomicrobiales bacterium]|nr:M56 family metallopeptidase [Verrucomicrobiales bacterium]
FACALYWFNPLVWIAARQMIAERERACDDIVLHHGAKPAHYAEQVLEIAASAAPARFAAYSGLPMARPSNLEGRLRAILDGTRNRAALTRTALLLALGALIVILIPLSMAHAAGGRTSSPAAQEPTVQPSVSGEDLPAYAAALPRPLNRRQRARLEQIVRQFRAENDRVTPQAIDELVSMGAGVAFPMIRLLSRGKTDRPALKVLERLAPDPGVQRLLCEAIRNGSANTRHCGLIALGNSGNQQHVSFIANHVPEHPIAAGFALSRLGGPSAREHLLAAFDRVATTHWHVLATQVREMNDPGAIEPLKGILARVEWPPNDRFPPATARSAVEAIRALEALKGGPAPTYPAHLTLRGDYGGNFKYPFNGPLPKSFSVDGPASYIRLPKADPATSAGREAIFQAITSGSRPRSFTMDRDRLLAFNGIRISPLTVRTEPPHHYWTDAVAKIAQRDLVEFVEQYSLRHRPVPGPVAGIHSYPLPNESNLFAILSPDRRVTIANVRRTSEDYTYGVDFYDLDPLYQLVNVVGEPMVEDLLRLAGAADPGSNPNPAGNPQSNAAAATIPPSRSARESDLPGWLKLLYDPGAGGLIVSVDDDQNVTSIYAVDQADDAFLSNLRTLPSLRELDIQVTSGITPAGLARLAELPALEKLNLYHVNVDGAGLGDDVLRIASRMSTLRELGVAECGVTDEGARHLKGMTQLTALSLAGNRLTDEGMKSLAGLTNLQELNLSGSSSIHADMQITDDGLKRLSRLTGLTGLSVDRLPISGRTLAFPRLQSLALSGDRVDDSSLEGILQCRDLRQLTLQYTAISDNGLARLAALTELRHLNLDSHVITDAGIASLNILPKLEFLWLRASRLTDDALRHLSEVKTLTRLDLFGSGTPGATYGRLFTSAGLQELEALPGLRELHIYNLESQDGFAGLRSLSQLRTLVLQHTGIRAETIKRLQDALPETEVSVPRATAEFSPARLSDQTEPPALENRNPSN